MESLVLKYDCKFHSEPYTRYDCKFLNGPHTGYDCKFLSALYTRYDCKFPHVGLNFSHVHPNLISAGLQNGGVAIWDLRKKSEQVETIVLSAV